MRLRTGSLRNSGRPPRTGHLLPLLAMSKAVGIELRHNSRSQTTALAFVTGEDLMQSWESSPGVWRFFASCCGSPIYKRDDADPEELGFRLGTLDSNPSMKAEMHYCVGSKAPWVEIEDTLGQEAGGPLFGLRD
jgi:hypothetical protein